MKTTSYRDLIVWQKSKRLVENLYSTRYSPNSNNSGVASLPTVIVLMILILAIGVGIAAMSFSENIISMGQKQSSAALLYAEAGARDALIRIARNKNYSTSAYQLVFVTDGCLADEGCATITVSTGVVSSLDPKIINSEGRVRSNFRKIKVEVVLDSFSNGEIVSAKWQEIVD